MKKIFFSLLVALAVCFDAQAQFQNFEDGNQNNNRNNRSADRLEWFWQHITFGGNIGLAFGNTTQIEINPSVGYRFNNYVTAGLTGTYEYYKYGSYTGSSVYGGGVFAEAYPFSFLTLHAESQFLNFEDYYAADVKRVWDTSFLVGAGYRKQISDIIYVNFLVLFNLNNNERLSQNVFGSNPIVRINIMF